MTDTTALPSVSSLSGWSVSVTEYGTLEVRLILKDKQQARNWATWLANPNNNARTDPETPSNPSIGG